MLDILRLDADVAQLVERRLAKAKVAGSRPVVRSMYFQQKDTDLNSRNRRVGATSYSFLVYMQPDASAGLSGFPISN